MPNIPTGKRKVGNFRHARDLVVVAILETGAPPEYAIVVSGYAVLDRGTREFVSRVFDSHADASKRLAELLVEFGNDAG